MKEKILAHRGSVEAFKFDRIENLFNIKLPTSYRNFLSKNDAPWIEKNHFKFNNQLTLFSNKEGIDSRDLNFLSFNNSPYGDGILDCQDFDGRSSIFVFGISANGDYICFDYGSELTSSEPKIVLMYHDAFDDKGQMLICDVASNFENFMKDLY